MSGVLHARCFCGNIRLTASTNSFEVSWCHCKDCRRQTGAPAVVWAGFRADELTIEGTPRRRRSSEQVVRSFCQDCGTPLTYEHDELPGEIYVHAGLFDEADRLVPDRQAYVTSKLFWMHLEEGLEKAEGS